MATTEASLSPPISLDQQHYSGTYVYAGTDAERASVEAAVDAATSGMVGKNIARHELMKRSEIRLRYSISFDAKGDVCVESLATHPNSRHSMVPRSSW